MSIINHTLNKMIGNVYEYKGTPVEIKAWAVVDGQYSIETNGKNICIDKSAIHDEIDKFKVLPPSQNGSTDLKTSKMEPIEDVLIDTIKKLQGEEGSKYVGQAKEINSSVSNLVNIQKVKIQMAKLKGEL